MGYESDNRIKKIPYNKNAGTGSGHDENLLMVYNCKDKRFDYPAGAGQWFGADFDQRPLWRIMMEDGVCSEKTAEEFHKRIDEIGAAELPQVHFTEYHLKDRQGMWRWYRVGLICPVPGEHVSITFTNIENEVSAANSVKKLMRYDKLTGLLNRGVFCEEVEQIQTKDPSGIAGGEYAMLYWNIVQFKAINDIFGVEEGDRLLVYIADALTKASRPGDVLCRPGSDHFIVFVHLTGVQLEEWVKKLLDVISEYDLSIAVTCSVGIYVTKEQKLSADSMIDRAILAQSAIKGSYTIRYYFYNEALRFAMLSEQEIVGVMEEALEEKQFVCCYQPQYNHSTGMLVGAEALVRWEHPERGLVSPGAFIPIFEKNGFITKLDFCVFEQVCSFLRRCMDENLSVVPISTNFSRHDIFQQNFVDTLERIRAKYEIPAKYLRVEITESAVMGSSRYINEVVKKLHHYGYIVEMDDFGSGYSSLNVLKDIDLDIIKLDMMFMSEESETNRGGTILSSVVRMAKWLGLPVIAEGVEKVRQADFLRSIGCDYIQGYLYSRPLPEQEYKKLISGSAIGAMIPQMKLIETLNVGNFWDPKSLETLIFSNYVGGAAIFDYQDGKVEILRVNKKYLQEICMNLSEKDLIESDPLRFFDEKNKTIYLAMLEKAIETAEEQECETWRTLSSSCCGNERICIRCNVRMIGRSGDNFLFYAMIRNITAEKEHYSAILDSERRFKMASEQINIYYWEYTIATKEMRPCFRCMRDLGLPPLLTNYPDSAIERGIFPPEVADMYRDWHRQVAEGVKELEAVIPLTMDRIPFRVRYTTEFDENGRPLKAYGSAALEV